MIPVWFMLRLKRGELFDGLQLYLNGFDPVCAGSRNRNVLSKCRKIKTAGVTSAGRDEEKTLLITLLTKQTPDSK
jgi:hypothetical protein